jgi:hypothetical protein
MECEFFMDFHQRARTIHAAGDKWAGRGGPALPGGMSKVGLTLRGRPTLALRVRCDGMRILRGFSSAR